jgi:hypothetical protein
VEGYARMASVSEDVLRIIGSNRQWMRNYGVVVGLARNPENAVAVSMNLMARLTDRDLGMLSTDRNVPDPLRIAARQEGRREHLAQVISDFRFQILPSDFLFLTFRFVPPQSAASR